MNKENIIKMIKDKNPNIEIVSIFNTRNKGKTRTAARMICECGKIFTKSIDHIRNSDFLLCKDCGRKIQIENRKKSYDKKYKKAIKSAGYTLVNPKEHLYANQHVEVIQDSTGFKGFIYPNIAKSYKSMRIFSLYYNKKNYIYNSNVVAKLNGIKSRVIDFETDKNDNIIGLKIQCKCGNIYVANIRAFERMQFYCPDCTKKNSKYEKIVQSFLDKNSIQYIREFRVNSCRDIFPLPFDFQLIDYNCFIEVDGEQHFDSVRFSNNPNRDYNKEFEIRKKHDKIKDEYCKKYNIPLLRVSYKDILSEKYKEKIIQFIQSIKD